MSALITRFCNEGLFGVVRICSGMVDLKVPRSFMNCGRGIVIGAFCWSTGFLRFNVVPRLEELVFIKGYKNEDNTVRSRPRTRTRHAKVPHRNEV